MRPRRRPTEHVRPTNRDTTRINDAIRVPRVRLIDDDGAQLGIKTTDEAREYAYAKNLDLVEVAAVADPPVAKVKVTIMFRGRETTHPERGRDLLLRLAEDVKEIGTIESQPLLDGRNMVMLLGPTKNAGVKRNAEDQNTERSEETVQSDGHRPDLEKADNAESQPGAQIVEA